MAALPANHDAVRILALGAPAVLRHLPWGGLAGLDYSQALAVCRWLDIRPGPRPLRQLNVASNEIVRLAAA